MPANISSSMVTEYELLIRFIVYVCENTPRLGVARAALAIAIGRGAQYTAFISSVIITAERHRDQFRVSRERG